MKLPLTIRFTIVSAALMLGLLSGAPVVAADRNVTLTFGDVNTKSSPVGNPPITKWFYPNFVVVFEHDKVLHAVVVGS